MKLIRHGITRTVLLAGRWAFKVPSTRAHADGLAGVLWSVSRGIQANLSELEWSKHTNPADPICPVRWSLLGGLINVYPRCEPVPVDADGEALIDLPPRLWLPLGDAKPDNFGLLAGEPVWIDYDVSYNGCPHDPGGVTRKRAQLAQDQQQTAEAAS